jgi:hypothetical protein
MKVLFYLFAGFIMILAVMPKIQLYYFGEQMLERHGIVLDSEAISEGLASLSLEHGSIYVKGVHGADFGEAELESWLFNTSLDVHNVTLDDLSSNFIPPHIDAITLDYSLIRPMRVMINAEGAFGVLSGNYQLLENRLELNITPSEMMLQNYPQSLKKLTKTETGYRYAITY